MRDIVARYSALSSIYTDLLSNKSLRRRSTSPGPSSETSASTTTSTTPTVQVGWRGDVRVVLWAEVRVVRDNTLGGIAHIGRGESAPASLHASPAARRKFLAAATGTICLSSRRKAASATSRWTAVDGQGLLLSGPAIRHVWASPRCHTTTAAPGGTIGVCTTKRSTVRALERRRRVCWDKLRTTGSAQTRHSVRLGVRLRTLCGSGSRVRHDLSLRHVEHSRRGNGGSPERSASVVQRCSTHERSVKDDIQKKNTRSPGLANNSTRRSNRNSA
jgi:hypothetical protein